MEFTFKDSNLIRNEAMNVGEYYYLNHNFRLGRKQNRLGFG